MQYVYLFKGRKIAQTKQGSCKEATGQNPDLLNEDVAEMPPICPTRQLPSELVHGFKSSYLLRLKPSSISPHP